MSRISCHECMFQMNSCASYTSHSALIPRKTMPSTNLTMSEEHLPRSPYELSIFHQSLRAPAG